MKINLQDFQSSMEKKEYLEKKIESKEFLNDDQVRLFSGLLNQLSKSKTTDYITNDQMPVLHSFAGIKYNVKSNIEGDYFVLYACQSSKDIEEFVEDVVANNFEIGKDYKSVIITGSNTGGKTVTLKTIGLFILMAKAGMFLPCTYAKLYPFKDVFADIGDSQSILQSLSTFSAHMTNIIEILNKSSEESFVLLDEVCAGTDPVEGAVLARGILEKLAQKQVTSVITTHYGELKALEYTNSFFKNASVEFNTETLKPTYKLLIGIPGLSNAISIASNLGLDPDIVNKAKTTLVTQKDPTVAVVEKLQETHQELSKNLEEAQK